MKIVAQQDQPFDVSGDGTDLRVVSRITAGGLSESGVLVFRLDFTNSTSGIFTASAAQAPGSSGGLQVDKSAGRSGNLERGLRRRNALRRVPRQSRHGPLLHVTGLGLVHRDGTEALVPMGAVAGEFFLVVPSSGGFEGSYGLGCRVSRDRPRRKPAIRRM